MLPFGDVYRAPLDASRGTISTEPHDGRAALSRLHRECRCGRHGCPSQHELPPWHRSVRSRCRASAAAGRALRFPERFFLGEDIGELSAGLTSLRSISKLSARQRDMALCRSSRNGNIESLA